MTKLNKDIFKRYLSNNYTAQDERYVMNQFNDKEAVSELNQEMEDDWNSEKAEIEKKDLSHVLDSIHTNIQVSPKAGKMARLYQTYSRIAAVLIVPLAILFVLKSLNNDYKQANQTLTSIYAPIGSKVQFLLPDGTKGWLKGGSELSYSSQFSQRHVNLSGEAFFDVFHNADRPFEVLGKESKIVVLGTRFSANMWPNNNSTEVVLESGKVKFVPKSNGQPTFLKPGERLIYAHLDQTVKVNEVEAEVHIAWVKGNLVFRGDNLQQVAEKLSEWYNVDVELQGNYPLEYKFRATFKDESINDVLRLMKLTAPISYQIIEPKQLQDGSFERQKVVLKMN
ncbi:FecR family protein [Carboxylicivirga sp. M1479]|uniref:FecR family protein n=1 Tax=Carboxylicivirga sp. M1479 TaxID=2594476 RepID=UPI0011786B6A|nr:FecR family protein [Carboxylicivirga sp. M1479]TRX66565.1 FecR family protein [Carboxylicivirga sp. M1479]